MLFPTRKQFECSLDQNQCPSNTPSVVEDCLKCVLFDLATASHPDTSLLKGSGRGEQSSHPAGARQEDDFPEIYVPEKLYGEVHGKLTVVRELIQCQLSVNFHPIQFCETTGSRSFMDSSLKFVEPDAFFGLRTQHTLASEEHRTRDRNNRGAANPSFSEWSLRMKGRA